MATDYDDWSRAELRERVEELEETRALLLAALDVATDPNRDTEAIREQLADEFEQVDEESRAGTARGW